eukprot:CAMPEP_0119051930 /NCGR_PEP_ID=MMETSP1177-20130426/73383_1 /TAXON_ID=2985 /ORGANISM="Ochromonas sp, Strain CCMP1899" /LENGTH=1845 /DNA_ID=CAMNT_0007031303 /DNA_START=346 /DNA_END=5881 /DNA_ORIENTATION=+
MDAATDRLEVKIVSANGLKSTESGPPSAYAEVVVGYNSHRTKQIPETNDPIWKSNAMSFNNLLADDIDTILIYVKHKDIFTGKDAILGYVTINMATYYGSPKVEIECTYDLLRSSDDLTTVPLGKLRTRIMYFNQLDDDMLELEGSEIRKLDVPNLLEVTVLDGKDMYDGKQVEAFVTIQIGDLRKETKSAKKSKNPTWNEPLQLPITDGNEIIDITVKHASILRNVFLGRIRIPMNEVAALGDGGVRTGYTLLNENLIFEGVGNGSLQLRFRWFFDLTTDVENKRNALKRNTFVSRIASFLKFKKKGTKEDLLKAEEEAAKIALLEMEEEEDNLDANLDNLDLSPYELSLYMEEQRKKRREELAELLEVQEVEETLKDGDYSIQVHIIEVVDLTGKNYSGLSDPYVEIEVLGVKKKTRFIKEVVGCVYDETFYFSFQNLKKEQVAEAHLKLTVKDHNYLWYDELIGMYQIDLISIYNKKDHEKYRIWGALRDPLNKEDSGSQGLIKFTATVLGPGDIQKVHDPVNEEKEAEEDLEASEGAGVVDPGEGSQQTLQFLVVSILKAEGLPGFDKLIPISTSGLYCFMSVEFGGCKPMKTTKISVQGKSNLSVTFEEELWIPIWVPTMCKRFALTIMNREFGRRDLVVATAYFDFNSVQKCETDPIQTGVGSFFGLAKKKYSGPALQYVHFYGANPKVRVGPKAAKLMNRFPNHGSAYRGSALVSLRVIKHPYGAENAHKRPMNYDIPDQLIPKPALYTFRLFMFSGSDFGSRGGHQTGKSNIKYAVAVSIGCHEIRSTFKEYANGACEWVELSEQVNIQLPEMRMMPDTFITLYKGTEDSYQSVAFHRVKTHTIMKGGLHECKPTWYELHHDQSHRSNKTLGYPGSVLLKTALVNVQDLEEPEDWESDRKKIEMKKPYYLRCYIYQCKGLPAINDNGLIDPYIKVRFNGTKQKTTEKKLTQCPDYFECLEFNQMLPEDLSLAPNILLQVWDSKQFSNTPIGAARFSVGDIPVIKKMLDSIPEPKWRKLAGIDGKGNMGEVLVSFWLHEKRDLEQALTAPKDIHPHLRRVWLDIHVIGLRDLKKPYGQLLNIRNPYLQFDVASQSFGDSMKTSQCRIPSPNDPNYLDRLILDTKLPEDPLFAPALEIKCYDSRMGSNIILGTLSVDLATYLPWNGAEYIPPRQHKILESTLTLRKEMALKKLDADARIRKGNALNDEDDDNDVIESEPILVPVDDMGVGVFAPEAGLDSRYLELPVVIDEEEINILKESKNKKRKKDKGYDFLGLNSGTDLFAGTDDKYQDLQLRRIIGFPLHWANTDFLTGREFWVQSKKEGEGGKLEDYLGTLPFEHYPLQRGHISFNKFGKRKDTTQRAGVLKAVIRVCTNNPRYDEEFNKFGKSVRQTQRVVVRLYVIRAQNLMPMDYNGLADPYLRISLGENTKKDTATVQDNTLNPDFFTAYDFETTLPGPSLMKIQVYDKNRIFSDKFMAETVVDLEDRWFHPRWTALALKPVENRALIKDGSEVSQGSVLAWIDILSQQDALKMPPVKISGPEKKEFEIRVVCWRSLDVPVDNGVSDLFTTFFMEGGKHQSTDTHWRCKNGKASWNWRIKLAIELPIKTRELGRLRIQLFERNITRSNQIIGEATVDIYDWLMLAYHRQEQPVYPFQEYKDAKKKLNRNNFLAGLDDGGGGVDGIPLLHPYYTLITPLLYPYYTLITSLLGVDGISGDDDEDDVEDDEEEIGTDDEADSIGGDDGGLDYGEGDQSDTPLLEGTKVTIKEKKEKETGKYGSTTTTIEEVEAMELDEHGNPKKDNGKTDPNEEPEESDLTKLVNQINEYIGVGDVIADDAEW